MNTYPFLWKNDANLEVLQELFCVLELSKNLFWVISDSQLKFLGDWILTQGSKMLNLLDKYITVSWGGDTILEAFQKSSPHIIVAYNFLLNFAKKLKRIFGIIEYWCRDPKYKTYSTNTKLFYGNSKAELKTFQKLFANIEITYKLFLKNPKSLNRIFWAAEYWCKNKKYHIW